jgi:hypothetical protein
MTSILRERLVAVRDDGIVVFLIGMRVNSWWKVHRWLPVARSMPPMLKELLQSPGSGLLGATFALTANGPLLVQYWESVDKLLDYASNRSGKHHPAWVEFNRRIGVSGDVGIWHETYAVPRGAFEAIYVNMPPFGLGKVARLEPARGKLSRARGRLAAAVNRAWSTSPPLRARASGSPEER